MGFSDRKSLLGLVLLTLGVVVLFLDTGAPNFFGDSVGVLWGRPHTWDSLLQDFVRLDGGHWFRPLSNSMPAFLLWPWFGLSFDSYHVIAVLLHLALSFGAFLIFVRILPNRAAAFIAAAFFAFHPIQFYATYGISFYQEPITAGLQLAALWMFVRYVNGTRWLPLCGAVVCQILSLFSKETAVVLPAALLVMLAHRFSEGRRSWTAMGVATGIAAVYAVVYANVLGVVFRYQEQYRPRWGAGIGNLWVTLQWAFGLPSGWQTEGWRYPQSLQLVLWSLLLGSLAMAAIKPRSGLWRGPAWFVLTGAPALLTPHLLPHHLYFPLLGIAYLVGSLFSLVRGWSRLFASGATAAVLSTLFVGAFIGARDDAIHSWVGRSAWEVHSVAEFIRAAGLRLPDARGVIVRTGKAPHLKFDWMSGDLFNLLGDEYLEVRVLEDWPAERPEGFYLLEYRDEWLWNRTEAATMKTMRRHPPRPRNVDVRLNRERIKPGEDSYCMEIPALAGKTIDVRYRYNERFPRIAYQFTRLNDHGNACLAPPSNVPWGTIDLVGVRPSGSFEWSPVSAQLQLLP